MPTTVSTVNCNHLMNSHQISPSTPKREKEVKEVKFLLLMAKIMTPKLNTITKLSMLKSKTIIFTIKMKKFNHLINKIGYNKLKVMVVFFTILQKISAMPIQILT